MYRYERKLISQNEYKTHKKGWKKNTYIETENVCLQQLRSLSRNSFSKASF